MRREGANSSSNRSRDGSNKKSSSRGRNKTSGDKTVRSPSQDSSSSHNNNLPPISQLTITRTSNNNDEYGSDAESMGSSASEITYGTRTSLHSQDHYSGSSNSPHCVTRMPFTDAYGDKGWYSGEVAGGSGLPHGQGTMHYCDGRMKGGWWSNGLSAGGPPATNNNVGGQSSWGQESQQQAPPSYHNQPPPMPLTNNSCVKNSQPGPPQHHNHRPAPSAPPKSNQQQQQYTPGESVFNIEWTDLNGQDGYYTGETDGDGEPHGLGSMHYVHDNSVLEGEWYHGTLEQRMHLNLGNNMSSSSHNY